MKQALIISVAVMGLGLSGPEAYANGYVVNGHAASPAEVQLLASYGAQPGRWVVDGYGISPAADGPDAPVTTGGKGRSCRYVLDVRLCD